MRYTFSVPIRGYAIFEIEADSEDEALETLAVEGDQVEVDIDQWDFNSADRV